MKNRLLIVLESTELEFKKRYVLERALSKIRNDSSYKLTSHENRTLLAAEQELLKDDTPIENKKPLKFLKQYKEDVQVTHFQLQKINDVLVEDLAEIYKGDEYLGVLIDAILAGNQLTFALSRQKFAKLVKLANEKGRCSYTNINHTTFCDLKARCYRVDVLRVLRDGAHGVPSVLEVISPEIKDMVKENISQNLLAIQKQNVCEMFEALVEKNKQKGRK